MLSLRSLTRQVPRTVSRIGSAAIRSAYRPAQLQAVGWKAAPVTRIASSFSTSISRFQESESANEELAAKLNSEIALEKDNQDDAFRESIKEYLDNSDYQIEDVAGQEEVHLTRTFGDEKQVARICAQ